MDKIVDKVNSLLKPLGLCASGIYRSKRGYIISGCLLNDPEEPLDDCLFMLENGKDRLREYGFTENPSELTEATKIENIIYSRKR